MAVSLRLENTHSPEDRSAIRRLNQSAFSGSDEAALIERLHAEDAVILSLLAESNRQIVGHILFSRMSIETTGEPVAAVSLAPMAVLPEFQKRGIGTLLVQHGLQLLRQQGHRIVIVLGHPHFYLRFGFSTRMARDLKSPFPPEAYMALELTPGALHGLCGTVKYALAFGL